MRIPLTVYAFFALIMITLINPIANYIFFGKTSLHSVILMPYFAISLLLLIHSRERFFLAGVITSLIFIIISFVMPYRHGDLLFLFYNLAFFSNGLLMKTNFTQRTNRNLFYFLFLIAVVMTIHSFGLAFGFWESPKINIDLLGQRIGRSGDILELIPFTVPFLVYFIFMNKIRIFKFTAYGILILGILRLIATGTRGITVAAILSGFYFLIFYQVSFRKTTAKAIFIGLIVFIPAFLLTQNFFIKQITLLTNQYIEFNAARGFDTGMSRIVEAENDYATFTENPFVGAGFALAAMRLNILGEPSYGHFFLTGMLARVGLIGTFLFLYAYSLFFIKLYNYFKADKAKQFFLVSTLIIIIAYMFLGNPLYLLMVWPVLPVFWSITLNYSGK